MLPSVSHFDLRFRIVNRARTLANTSFLSAIRKVNATNSVVFAQFRSAVSPDGVAVVGKDAAADGGFD